MEKRDDIIIELTGLGSSLANTSSATPYQLPDGYFEAFPTGVMAVLTDVEPVVQGISRASAYAVPDGYFSQLPDLLLQKVKAEKINDSDPAGELAELSPLLRGISKKMPYSVPGNYFADLITPTIREDDEQLPAFLIEARTKNPYTVPDDYFASRLPGNILNLVKPPAKGKLFQGTFGRNLIRYAAAAVITGIVVTSGFFILTPAPTQNIVSATGLEEKASQTSDEDILNYLENQSLPLPADLQTLSANADIEDDAIHEMLADVTDEELQQYVQAQSGS